MIKDRKQELVEENNGYIPDPILAKEQQILNKMPKDLKFQFTNMVMNEDKTMLIHYRAFHERN